MGYDLLPGERYGLLKPEIEVVRYHVVVWHPTHKCKIWTVPDNASTVRSLIDAALASPGSVPHFALADAILETDGDSLATFVANAIARRTE